MNMWEAGKIISDVLGRKQHVKMFRAMPRNAKYIRTNDYITPSKKFAIEHAVTSAIYNDEPYKVVMSLLDSDNIKGANNPDEYIWIGNKVPARSLVIVDEDGDYRRAKLDEKPAYSLKRLFLQEPNEEIKSEDTVPQGDADDRPLHGAPKYFISVGRSLPDAESAVPKNKARAWNKDGSLVSNKNKNKKRWYSNESKKSIKKIDKTFHEKPRQNNVANIKSNKKTTEKNKKIKEYAALSTAAVDIAIVKDEQWDSHDAPRVDNKKIDKNNDFIKKLDVVPIEKNNNVNICVDKLDPQYKRQVDIIKHAEKIAPWKEPSFLKGRGEHRISKLGYAKIADRKGDLKTDVYLAPYDPNWRRSEDMMQQIIKHRIANHGNPGAFPDKDYEMFVSIKEEWEEVKNLWSAIHEQNNNEEIYYHGTNKNFKPGDYLEPPLKTGNISEKGRKKNLDKVFFTKDKHSAKIYAGRAVNALGGEPYVYIVKPLSDPEWVTRKKGTTVLMAPRAQIIKKL